MQSIRGRWLRPAVCLVALAVFGAAARAGAADEKEPPPKGQPPIPGVIVPEAQGLRRMQAGQVSPLLELIRALQDRRRRGGMPNAPAAAARLDGRLGIRMEAPSEAVVHQLDLPQGVGVVISEVIPDSPAARAGLKANDILLELDGKPVPSDAREFVKNLNAVKADTPVQAVVLRRGKREAVKGLSLPEARAQAVPADPRPDNPPQVPRARVPGLLPLPGLVPGMPAGPNRRVPAVPLPIPLP